MEDRRSQIIEIVRREFIGPDPINLPGMIQENGEEILSSDPPRIRYAAGILFPQEVAEEYVLEGYEPDIVEPEIEDDAADRDDIKTGGVREYLQDAEELLNLSNAYQQSALSITAAVKRTDVVRVCVSAGVYTTKKEIEEASGIEKSRYYRSPIKWDNNCLPLTLPQEGEKSEELIVTNDWVETHLRFHVTYRYSRDDYNVYTFTLENSKKNKASRIKDEDCYFQVEFSLDSQDGFQPLPDSEKLNINDDDYLSNQMLYRNIRSYAIGHGCGAEWREENGLIKHIHSSIFPTYEIKPILPRTIEGVPLEMYSLSDVNSKEKTIAELKLLCDKYEEWIRDLPRLDDSRQEYRATAQRHIANCQECLDRMRDGITLMENDEEVLKAFQLMNKAMLMQQLHYNLPLQKWRKSDDVKWELEEAVAIPDIDDKSTWGENAEKYGKWRPFQLAFVLINLRSMRERDCESRKIVDLIWFPTGGGKTEAYLGLSAYTIFIRRLMNKNDAGTAILMRYTLRLLTAQQYERASAMICACEFIRSHNPSLLGEERISIGLWVGDDTSPNSMDDATGAYNKRYKGLPSEKNPFIILKCPWCGAQMGVVGKGQIAGYKIEKQKSKRNLVMQCSNLKGGCHFSKIGITLPLYIVDDDIYTKTPTLLLGTVDKFAMLPYRPEAQTIFGIQDGTRVTAPDLIIQDELHLISGPLGSMVGHYETMIHELSSYKEGEIDISPKVIASTATISRAAEQCHALYGCGKSNVKQFPPAGIDAGDSFFAEENNKVDGRRYVGILASAASSIATTTIRLYASLLYAAKAIDVENEADRDPYWTNIGYFNSIRELGQTETWIRADIDEYLHIIYKRRYEDIKGEYKKKRRYIYEDKELTSRVSSDKIPFTLQELAIKYPTTEGEKRPVDICLATNMISVGVDVPRLGLMTVSGQPKTTSEYIQATSRVGRNSDAPGLVFTIYNPGKPRDKSHYEQFIPYHSRVYCNVEPTSVTPFSAPLRERALHALLIGIFRLEGNRSIYLNPPTIPSDERIEEIKEIIAERVRIIDPSEVDATMKHLDSIIDSWRIWEPEKYQDFTNDIELPLMFPAGSMRNEEWGKSRGFQTPTSMRSVDASCEARVLEYGYSIEE